MKKFGIGKKGEEGEDASRSKLFGRASKNKSPAQTANPYAAPQNNLGQDPYAKPSPYQDANGYGGMAKPPMPGPGPKSHLSQPPGYSSGGYGGISDDATRREKSPVPPGGYGNTGYGNMGGYGGDRYGSSSAPSNEPNSRSGGYGGLGPSGGQDDASRSALFGGARERFEDKQTQPQLPPEDGQPGTGYGMEDEQHYGTYQERQLTAEEEEEEDVDATKQEIRAIKQQDVSSTRNALRLAAQAEESGRGTLERLGTQSERIHNTEKNLDLAANSNREAEDKAREIKHLNRSMWAMKVDNPFTKARRKDERDQAILDTHRMERAERDASRAAAWASANRQQEHQRNLKSSGNQQPKSRNLAERTKYQFEADSDDERAEDEIEDNIDQLHGAAGRLNTIARSMGKEVDTQNKHIERIQTKSEKVDDGIAMNRARLDRISRRG